MDFSFEDHTFRRALKKIGISGRVPNEQTTRLLVPIMLCYVPLVIMTLIDGSFWNGDMDTSIVIRTFIIKGKKAYFQVGGGIVTDSDPEKEYQETLDKGRALVEAIRIQKAIGLQQSSSV